MAILVTRPEPDNAATAAALVARGYRVLSAPMLRFEALAMPAEPDARYAAIIVTSANALRAIADQPVLAGLRKLRLYAVGERTASVADELGFRSVVSGGGDAAALRDAVIAHEGKPGKKKSDDPLLYLAGADLARDLAGDLGAAGFTVVTHTAYRMVPVATLPRDALAAFAAGEIAAILHYSRRSARAFVSAAQADGVETTALALSHVCLSEAVATELRDRGAARTVVAGSPDENSLFTALGRAIPPGSR